MRVAERIVLDLNDVSGPEETDWVREMDDDARLRVEKTAHLLRRRQRIAGDHLARTALAKLIGCTPSAVKIFRTPLGKPYAEGAFFSVSHSGALVVCAAGLQPVGVDAEQIRPFDSALAERFFTAEEQEELAAAEDKTACFWQIWTGKEALVKLTGEGVAALKRADTRALPPETVLSWERMGEHIIATAEKFGG